MCAHNNGTNNNDNHHPRINLIRVALRINYKVPISCTLFKLAPSNAVIFCQRAKLYRRVLSLSRYLFVASPPHNSENTVIRRKYDFVGLHVGNYMLSHEYRQGTLLAMQLLSSVSTRWPTGGHSNAIRMYLRHPIWHGASPIASRTTTHRDGAMKPN